MASIELILPVFQEAAQIPAVFPQVVQWLARNPNASAVFVDDGSADETADIIARAISQHPDAGIRLVRSPTNRGKGAVVRDAMLAARGDVICFTDGDLAYSLDQVDRLVKAITEHGADVAIGSRQIAEGEASRPEWRRRLSGSIFNLAVRVILNLPYADTQAGLKAFRAAAASRIFARSRIDGFAFDAEILYLARQEGFRVVEIPAQVTPGHASLGSTVSLVRDPLRMLMALLRVRRLHRGTTRAKTAPVQ